MRLIDADKLKKEKYTWESYEYATEDNDVVFVDDIDNAPTVDPVKHGRWKPWDLTWGRSVYYCTSCGEAGEVPTEMGKPIYAYCPNCGARMDGDAE